MGKLEDHREGRTGHMIGPGKYDNLTTSVRQITGAKGVVLFILEGGLGTGFSVQVEPEVCDKLPAMLREVADKMDHDHQKLKGIINS